MKGTLRRWWPALKTALALAILFVIGRRFWLDLHQEPELWRRPLHPGWLALSGLLYLSGLSFSALCWYRLLGHLGVSPPLGRAFRAYYIGHLGKYLPGKAWALFLRAGLVQGGGVRVGLATLTAFYEVLTTMTAGVLVAAVLFTLVGPDTGVGPSLDTLRHLLRLHRPEGPAGGAGTQTTGPPLDWGTAVLLSLLLLATLGVLLLPPVFNRLAHRLSLPFRETDAGPLPRIRLAYLAEGLMLTAVGWLLLGASLGAALQGILGGHLAWTGPALVRLVAIMGLSYVAGFVILVAPSGLGVREFFLTLFLAPELAALAGLGTGAAQATAVLAVLVLRLVWTAAELVAAAALSAARGPRSPAGGVPRAPSPPRTLYADHGPRALDQGQLP
jgi:hypothetical protein